MHRPAPLCNRFRLRHTNHPCSVPGARDSDGNIPLETRSKLFGISFPFAANEPLKLILHSCIVSHIGFAIIQTSFSVSQSVRTRLICSSKVLLFSRFLGYRQMTAALRQIHNINCSRTQVQHILRDMDPVASRARRGNCLVRVTITDNSISFLQLANMTRLGLVISGQ